MNETLAVGALSAAGALDFAAMYALARLRGRAREAVLLELRPPARADLDVREWALFYRSLFGIAAPLWRRALLGESWISLELWGGGGRVVPRCWVPRRMQELVRLHLLTAVPGLEVIELETPPELLGTEVARSRLKLWREPLYPLAEPRSDALRTAVAALAGADHAVMQLVLSPDVGWQGRALKRIDREVGGRPAGFLGSPAGDALDIFLPRGWQSTSASPLPARPSLRLQEPPSDKALAPCFAAEVRLRIGARTDAEARSTMHALVAAFRSLDGSNSLRPARVWRGRAFDRSLTDHATPSGGLSLSADELAHLYHIPVLSPHLAAAPVRIVPESFGATSGKVLFVAEDAGQTAVLLAQEDQRQHIHVCGPSGAGKSAELHNLAQQDAALKTGFCVIDCKGDLIRALLESLPSECADRVILVDPSRREMPVGINVLDCPDPEDAELVCDQSVAIFHKQFERFWGPRTDDLLRGAVLTLLRHPGSTLCEVPLLLQQPEARQQYTAGAAEADPIGLGSLWQAYERMSESGRLAAAGPVLNKLRSILMRPTVRNIFGQSQSTVDFREAMDSGKIVLVSLAKGLLGEETSHLLGAFIVSRIWQAAMARADRPESWRPDFNLYLDEFQNYLHLPHSIDEILVEARGYHLCLTLAHQHLSQLPRPTRDALLANAHTRIVFQCGDQDARALQHEFDPSLSAHDLRDLERFQVAARICIGGRTQPPITGITLPPPRRLRDASELAEVSLNHYGKPRSDVEKAILDRLTKKGFRAGAQPK